MDPAEDRLGRSTICGADKEYVYEKIIGCSRVVLSVDIVRYKSQGSGHERYGHCAWGGLIR